MTTRRTLITGLISFIAAPAIVRATSLMPVKTFLGVDPPFAPFEFSSFYSTIPCPEMTKEMRDLLMARINDAEEILIQSLYYGY